MTQTDATTTQAPGPETPASLDAAIRAIRWRTRLVFGAIAMIAVYFVYAWFAFDVSGVISRAQPDRAATFAKDAVAHKIHVTKDLRNDALEINIESELTATFDEPPSWVEVDGPNAVVDLGDAVTATIAGDRLDLDLPDYGALGFTVRRRGIETSLPEKLLAESETYEAKLLEADLEAFEEDLAANAEAQIDHVRLTDQTSAALRAQFERDGMTEALKDRLRAEMRAAMTRFYDDRILADWVSITDRRIEIRIAWDKRVQATASKIEVHRYFYGWENFWFDFGSPLQEMSVGELWSAAWSDQRIDPAQTNASLIWSGFWNNKEWRHGYVFTALFETILMAFIGTALASMVGLPLAFLAARNFTPSMVVRFGLRRLFDFLRGIDMLIWSLIFIRAFGLGPLTGAMAIAFTDTGTLGKLFSEALENVDNKQIEGVRATGANQLQRYRFGVIPQILPVFISQTLYYLESNTRSATVIGALGAGGIGLVLVETMNTQRDWENVLWLIILTILVVVLMDQISSWLRRRLIEGGADGRN